MVRIEIGTGNISKVLCRLELIQNVNKEQEIQILMLKVTILMDKKKNTRNKKYVLGNHCLIHSILLFSYTLFSFIPIPLYLFYLDLRIQDLSFVSSFNNFLLSVAPLHWALNIP